MQAEWTTIRDRLLKTVGQNNFTTWIDPLTVGPIEDGICTLFVPTNFFGNYVSQNFADLLLHEMQSEDISISRLKFAVAPQDKPAAIDSAPARPKPAAAAQPANSQINAAPLDARFSFDNFVVGKPNELAHAAARRVAEGGPVTFNPLFLYGGVGLGKTHLMQAAGNLTRQLRPEAKVVYVHSERFVADMVKALQHNKINDFKRYYRSLDALLIDDIQFFSGKEHSQEEFFHTFNTLLEGQRQIVITSDRFPREISGVQERLISRFGSGLTVPIDPPELETRMAILKIKAQQKGVDLPEDVCFFVAKQIRSNVRELEGALHRIIASANFTGRKINTDLAREALRDLLVFQERQITIQNIQKVVAEYFKMRISDLHSKRRNRQITRPRQIAMALAKELTTMSLPEIGDAFGGRDHTTVLHAQRKVSELIKTDPKISEDYQNLQRLLSG